MQGYVRVAAKGTAIAMSATTSKKAQAQMERLHAIEGHK
jgi:hypothetical protein